MTRSKADMKHPDRAMCLEYLKEYGTPPHVIGHCKSVAAVAWKLGEALNRAGGTDAPAFSSIGFDRRDTSEKGRFVYEQGKTDVQKDKIRRMFDLELVLAAGLLHDVARVEEEHWAAGSAFCRKKNLQEEAKIVMVHMQYNFTNDAFSLTEADLVSLGDRLTLQSSYAGLDERMDYIIRKAQRHGNPNAREKILEKKAETQKLLTEIEKRIGMSIDDLMENLDYENVETRSADDNR